MLKNQYKLLKTVSIIISLCLVITSLPPLRAEGFIAAPGDKNLYSLAFAKKLSAGCACQNQKL